MKEESVWVIRKRTIESYCLLSLFFWTPKWNIYHNFHLSLLYNEAYPTSRIYRLNHNLNIKDILDYLASSSIISFDLFDLC